jgi:hypothetical protein
MHDDYEQVFQAFAKAMDKSENYPAVLEGECRLVEQAGTPAEGGFTFRYVIRSFRELLWVVSNCFPPIPGSRLPGDIYSNLSQYPAMRSGGCVDDYSGFSWKFEKLEG